MIAVVKVRPLGAWWNTAKRFSVRGFVWAAIATLCSSSVRIAIADSAIAARHVVRQRGSGNAVKPTAAIQTAQKANWTTGTGNATTDSARPRPV
jgi:hypothetical protein